MSSSNKPNFEAFIDSFVSCVSEDELRVDELLVLLESDQAHEALGEVPRLIVEADIEAAQVAVRRGFHATTGQIESMFFALSEIIQLLPVAREGRVSFSELPPELLFHRVSLFYHLNELSPKRFSYRLLISLEVEANCRSGVSVMRIGEHGSSRISDLLYGPDSDKALAIELLERAHRCGVTIYDSTYSDLILSKAECKNAELRQRIDAVAEYIRSNNPGELLPEALTMVLAGMRSGRSPADMLRSQEETFGFGDKEMGELALAAADRLSQAGDDEAVISLLSSAAKYLGTAAKMSAWVGILIGDKFRAARAILTYGLQDQRGSFFGWIERFHSVELGCRLLYGIRTIEAREELEGYLETYHDAGFSDEAARISEWLAAFESFSTYVETCLISLGIPSEDPDELRISQRRIATWHYLRAIVQDDSSEFNEGFRWFEKSAEGNDAPWIEGERLFLSLARASEGIFQMSSSEKMKALRTLEERLLNASTMLQSHYPIAMSLTLRGLLAKADEASSCIADLSMAARMLEPTTPEAQRLRELIESARWDALTQLAGDSDPLIHPAESWRCIMMVVPLLAGIVGEDRKLRDNFAPYRRLLRYHAPGARLEQIRSLADANQRGAALEDMIVEMVEASPGLTVLDVRHRNSYEEIDIIVACAADDPLLSYWGPVIVIECKNWSKKVGTEPVRAFYTKMTTKKGAVRLGIMIATSGFTKGVKEVVRNFPDGLIVTLPLEDLLPVAEGISDFSSVLRSAIPVALFA